MRYNGLSGMYCILMLTVSRLYLSIFIFVDRDCNFSFAGLKSGFEYFVKRLEKEHGQYFSIIIICIFTTICDHDLVQFRYLYGNHCGLFHSFVYN